MKNKRINNQTTIIYIVSVVFVVLVMITITLAVKQASTNTEKANNVSEIQPPVVMNEGTINIDPSPSDTTGWNTYTDEVAGFSFKYPDDWKVGISSRGVGVLILPAYETRYRDIEILVDSVYLDVGSEVSSSSTQAVEASSAVQMFAESYGTQGIEGINATTVQLGEIQAVELSNIPYVIGYHSQIVFYQGEYRYTVTLSQGGHHEGIPDYDDPLAQEDLQLMRTIVATMQFTQ